MGILALEPCQIYFLHLPVDTQFLMVPVVTVAAKPAEILLCETRLQKS